MNNEQCTLANTVGFVQNKIQNLESFAKIKKIHMVCM